MKGTILASLLLAGTCVATAQTSFHKGSLLISLSEGGTYTRFKTASPYYAGPNAMIAPPADVYTSTPDVITDGNVNGDRDPLCIEYGVSNRIGLSICLGGDVLNVNPVKYYGTALPGKTKAITSEATFDFNYHFLATRKVDLSAYFSIGIASLTLRNYDLKKTEYQGYQHQEEGSIIRLGTRARYYFGKRIGVVGMVSAFVSTTSTANIDGNTLGGHDTKIRGCAIEVGPCIRLLK